VSVTVASRSQRVSLIVIPFCLSGCLSVIPRPTAYHDWSITTKFGRQVYTCPRTRVSLFGSPISHTLGAREKNMQNFTYFQRQPFNAYSCHCKRDASCDMTCLSVCLSVCLCVCTLKGNGSIPTRFCSQQQRLATAHCWFCTGTNLQSTIASFICSTSSLL